MNKKDFLLSTRLGMQFALTLAIFTGAGYWLDKKLGTLPLMLVVLGAAGFAAGMYYLIKQTGVKLRKRGTDNYDKSR